MSMYKIPLTALEEAGLKKHGLLKTGPSQLSDCFRQGLAWGINAEKEACAKIADGAFNLPHTLNEFDNGWASCAIQISQAIRLNKTVLIKTPTSKPVSYAPVDALSPLPTPANPEESDGCTYACPEGFSAEQLRNYAKQEILKERAVWIRRVENAFYEDLLLYYL